MPLPKKSYEGQRISLLTQHGKEQVMGPIFADLCGAEVVHTQGFDTDRLGTFTREVSRSGSQLDAARKKAQIGMALTGLKLGLASEGSFSPDPYSGLFNWNYELVILVDEVRQLELHWVHSGECVAFSTSVTDWDQALTFASKAQFPSHHLVIRPDGADHPECRKGLATQEDLKTAFDWAMGQTQQGVVFMENDLRAHANPTRMNAIRQAATVLAQQMTSLCPACGSVGFWVRDVKRGLPCRCCGQPTSLPVAKRWTCKQCGHHRDQAMEDSAWADPRTCTACNP